MVKKIAISQKTHRRSTVVHSSNTWPPARSNVVYDFYLINERIKQQVSVHLLAASCQSAAAAGAISDNGK